MIEYAKIETMFERDEQFSVTEVLKRPILSHINQWVVTEKIDGTNVRVDLRRETPDAPDVVTFGGRSAAAQMPADLVAKLFMTFPVEKMAALRKDVEPVSITLFGEGYGPGIQKGGGDYRSDKGFILFDVLIADKWWLADEAVSEISSKLEIPRAPYLGLMTLAEIVSLVKGGFDSECATRPRKAEGIVARTVEPLFDARGKRLIIKLKTNDWKGPR